MSYIHGYSQTEQERLLSQNDVLAKYIYEKINFTAVKHLLEVGCGVGAQMIKVLKHYDHIMVSGIDISSDQIEKARVNLYRAGISDARYKLYCKDILGEKPALTDMPDALLMVWLLEHVQNPVQVLKSSLELIAHGSLIAITEVYHNAFGFHPMHPLVSRVWDIMINHQAELNGDANVGILLYNIMKSAGVKNIKVEPYLIYIDDSESERKYEQFIYWRDLIQSAMPELIEVGKCSLSTAREVYQIMTSLASDPESVFYYSFIQGFGNK